MKINEDDDDNGDHVFVSINPTRLEPNIEPDNIWDYLKLLGFDDATATVVHIDMEDDNVKDDDCSFLSGMEENDIILETPPFTDDDDSDDDLYRTSPLLPVLVHTPNVSDEE
jgi:hypothetical protein